MTAAGKKKRTHRWRSAALRGLNAGAVITIAGSGSITATAQTQPAFCTPHTPCANLTRLEPSGAVAIAISRDGTALLVGDGGLANGVYRPATGVTSFVPVDSTFPFLPAPSLPASFPPGSGGGLLNTQNSLFVTDLNADGTIVVGSAQSGYGQWFTPGAVHGILFGGRTYAFAWSAATGGQRLISTQGMNAEDGYATSVSDDGRVVIGWSSLLHGDIRRAQRWTNTNGTWSAADLGSLYNGDMTPSDVSANGTVVVGTASRTDGTGTAFRWTATEGLSSLGALTPSGLSRANAVSGDGRVIVGNSQTGRSVSQPSYPGQSFPQSHAYRWTATGGMADLGAIGGDPAFVDSNALATNNDGSVIVGSSGNSAFSNASIAFRWTQRTGMKDLNGLLAGAGVDLSGIVLASANGVSGDGKIIVGTMETLVNGFRGLRKAFIARYDDFTVGVTSPSSALASLDSAQESRAHILTDQGVLAGELLGRGARMKSGAEVGAYGAWGSSAGGVHGQAGWGGFSLFGGLARTTNESGAASLGETDMGALGLRYETDETIPLRPFIEIGGWAASDDKLELSRSYANGAGVASGAAVTTGHLQYMFTRVGGRVFDTDRDQLVLAAEYGKQAFKVQGFAEPTSATNPFPAAVASGKETSNVARLQAQWSRDFDGIGEATFMVEGVSEYNRAVRGLETTIAGLGTVAPAPLEDSTYAGYGVSLARDISRGFTAQAGVRGIIGNEHTHAGAHLSLGIRASF